ncbi:piggyBac transposable element-derived protein 4-like [Chanos chanos]|uniref:PiggyBac transposable element-derived protein 4-like n=1 Tax=Chanos chanos TaxID=29144 RepID=A0A6J2W3Q7_CHACN|nr:piggyBac transposable element-derived protein 4-like [Chanos chanos]
MILNILASEDSEDGSWRTGQFTPSPVTFDGSQSGVRTHPHEVREGECFKLFLNTSTVGVIANETNKYAEILREKSGGVGKIGRWVDTSVAEIYTFLATVMIMGLVKKNNMRDYWTADPMLSTPFFPIVFSQDRFFLLLHALHFSDSSPSSDPLHKIRNILNSILKSFSHVFYPHKDLCINESILKWKGRLSFKQYILSKRRRFGVKLFVLCDVLTGYVQDLIVYTGSSTDILPFDGAGMSGAVVLTLLQPYLNKGHPVFMDNWYSSPALFQCLLDNQTGACGTVRPTRKGIPQFEKKKWAGESLKPNIQRISQSKTNFTTLLSYPCLGKDGRSCYSSGLFMLSVDRHIVHNNIPSFVSALCMMLGS